MSLKGVWKKRANERVIEWAKQMFRPMKPIKIDASQIPQVKQAIDRVLREVNAKPVTMMIFNTTIYAPKKNIVFINIDDVQVV